MNGERVQAAVVAPAGGFGPELAAAVGVEATQLSPDALQLAALPSCDRLVWIHALPARPEESPPFGESELLLASVETAGDAARAAGARLTFLALLPAQGLYTGALGEACDLARATMRGLLESRVAAWSQQGWRLLGVVHGGLEGAGGAGQRGAEAVRRRTPMDRPGTLRELAAAVRYLGSDRAEYVTGTFLHVDGGWRAYSWIYPARTI